MEALRGFERFDEARWLQLAERYDASFLVLPAQLQLDFPILYDRRGFIVYMLPSS